jgi:hypothetical protein
MPLRASVLRWGRFLWIRTRNSYRFEYGPLTGRLLDGNEDDIPSSRALAALVAVVTGACLATAIVAGIIDLRIA